MEKKKSQESQKQEEVNMDRPMYGVRNEEGEIFPFLLTEREAQALLQFQRERNQKKSPPKQ